MTFSTDAGGVDPERLGDRGLLHPRTFGTYPHVLGHYVRDERVLPLEDAVRKMTSAVANRLFLRDRGLLREGMKAAVVLFDPESSTTTRHSSSRTNSRAACATWGSAECACSTKERTRDRHRGDGYRDRDIAPRSHDAYTITDAWTEELCPSKACHCEEPGISSP